MKGNFKFKYDNRNEYLMGIESWMKTLDNWQEADEDFERTFDLSPDEKNLELHVELSTTRTLPVD